MSIERKVKEIERLFGRLEEDIATFQSESSLSCKAGCGKCCNHPEINASPLEFLPWAFHLFLNGDPLAVLEELNAGKSAVCHLYKPVSVIEKENGSCSEYKYRGLICRLFGYGASRDKLGELRLVTCKIIKENQKESFEKTVEAMKKGLYVPIFTDYYMHLNQIDFRLGNTIVPINKAMKIAIEEVLHYYAYRPLPEGHKTTA
ncbi:YkgJ family cysteine cluster protein [Arenibacter sp. 6A1]|uniref:YkgJ family cysteine cluster protein n=1 Tax=Arenibacter sp. 6A1 TaxID=2720391 RepID=UPI001446649F|nr:YkgJ family cysteine cluster protein [Arenibacter sp. 6A1]NKI27329.1 YkgJ family cysteine cluster protein [Arenibacter sp. 6A1]